MTQLMPDVTNPTAATVDAPPAMPHPFKVASVEKAGAPDGGQGKDWYCYVLASGRSTVTGHRRGSRQDVLAYATQCTERLNAHWRTGQSIWSPRGKKPTPA